MADFKKAFQITVSSNEGGYNPGVGEDETYRGIDRGANPGWSGWKIIDSTKKNNPVLSIEKMNLILSQNVSLQSNIEKFYETNYWNTIALDQVADQQLADNLFDCSVNQGSGLARQLMQAACNYVITADKLPLKSLVIDGEIGPVTLKVFNDLPPEKLNAEINAKRETAYRLDNGFKEWGKNWQRRLKKYT